MLTPELFGAMGSLVVALFGFLLAWRRLSGKIATTEASKLWDAAEAMRKETREDLGSANKRIVELEKRTRDIDIRNDELERENMMLQNRVEILEHENESLHTLVASLQEALRRERENA